MRMRLFAALALAVGATLNIASPSQALEFYPITSVVSDNTTPYFPIENLIQGPGVGFDVNAPHNRTSDLTWVTTDPGGFPSDFIAVAGTPILVLDLGANVELNSISNWGYATNANGVSKFSLRFATSAEGPAGFGTSIDYNPTFDLVIDHIPMQLSTFTEDVTARYVEYTALDNFFMPPGDGSAGGVAGGDRVGLGEIAFASNLNLLPADVNTDGVVDLADYSIIRDNFYTGTTPEDGDVNLDGIVSEVDFRIWKEAFGGGGPSSVPEPGTWALAIVGLAGAYALRRRSA